MNVQELNRREKTVVYMYASEAKYLAYLRQALQVLVKPLDDLAKGVTLTAGGGECVCGRLGMTIYFKCMCARKFLCV